MNELFGASLAFVNKIRKMDMLKVFSMTAISTLVKMITGFVSIKVVAILIDPEGISLMGQLNNFISIMLIVASVGINNGVTKYIAQYKESENRIRTLTTTAFKITVYGSLVCGLFMIIFSSWLSQIIMFSANWRYIFVIFGFTIIFSAINSLLISVVNGLKNFDKFVKINIANSIIGLIFSVVLVWTMGLKGALIGIVTYQSVMVFITLWILRKDWWLARKYFIGKFDNPTARKYFHYTLMAFVSAATVPVSQLILRGYVISNISGVEAGWWEAMNRISNVYLMVLTTSFGVYYLPRLSELRDRISLRNEIFKAYKLIIPMLLVGFTVIYFLRFFIIKILFTDAFLPMNNLFIWQLSGDLFKISSWLLAFLMVAKRMTKTFIATEIIFTASYVGIGFILLNLNGIVGLTQGYLINYAAYTVVMVVIFRTIIFARL